METTAFNEHEMNNVASMVFGIAEYEKVAKMAADELAELTIRFDNASFMYRAEVKAPNIDTLTVKRWSQQLIHPVKYKGDYYKNGVKLILL